jgi:hypothetical protein
MRFGYYDNHLVDNHSCVIVGVQATAARMSQETVAAQGMLTRFTEWQGQEPESVGADTTYGNGEFLQRSADRSITPYMRTRDSIHRKRSPFFAPERFTYEPEHDRYICPAGQPVLCVKKPARQIKYENFIGRSRLLLQCLSNRSRGRIRKRSPPHPIRHRCKTHCSIFCHFPRHRCRECGHRCFAQAFS